MKITTKAQLVSPFRWPQKYQRHSVSHHSVDRVSVFWVETWRREKDSFYYIIVQDYDLRLHPERIPNGQGAYVIKSGVKPRRKKRKEGVPICLYLEGSPSVRVSVWFEGSPTCHCHLRCPSTAHVMQFQNSVPSGCLCWRAYFNVSLCLDPAGIGSEGLDSVKRAIYSVHILSKRANYVSAPISVSNHARNNRWLCPITREMMDFVSIGGSVLMVACNIRPLLERDLHK